TEPVYVLNKSVDSTETNRLNPILGKAVTAVYGIEQAMADPTKAANSGIKLPTLPAGMDIFTMLQNPLMHTLAQPMLNSMNEKLGALSGDMIVQSAAPGIKAEYTALGIDTTAVQNNYILQIGAIMLVISLISGCS